jgi:predicted phage gp36 major capsid-like protein
MKNPSLFTDAQENILQDRLEEFREANKQERAQIRREICDQLKKKWPTDKPLVTAQLKEVRDEYLSDVH